MPSDAALADLRAALERSGRSCATSWLTWASATTAGLAYDQNFADSSQVTAERGEVEALANSLKETLAEVEHALAKFEAGTYGQCESCGQPIAPARLEAKPGARFCIELRVSPVSRPANRT